MFVLDKMSSPGWEFKSDYIEHILWLLDQSVCRSCKMTEKEYLSHEGHFDIEDDGINPLTFCEFKPETYDQLSALEKVQWLLGTACGCEFDLYKEGEGSSLGFVEIDLDFRR